MPARDPAATAVVLVPSRLAPSALDILARAPGLAVRTPGRLGPEQLREAVHDVHGLIVRSDHRIDAAVIDAAPKLRVIGRAGTGVDNIDVAHAARRGVVVMNTPGVNAVATAEHTLALLLALARHVPAAERSLRAGRWERARYRGVEVRGKTLGILGLGRVGREVAAGARGLGMQVIVHDPLVSPAAAPEGVEWVDLEALWPRADFVTLHTPLTPATRHLVGARTLAAMRPGVRVLNVARGGLVDEAALCDALDSGHVAGAALDVFEDEPPRPGRLLHHEKVVLTPHLGGSTLEAQERVGTAIAHQVVAYLIRGETTHVVRPAGPED